MEWIYLLVAGLLEVGWAVGMKYTDGFTRPLPTVVTVVGMIASVFFLALAVQTIPLGTGYAVWTGIGAVGTVLLGIVLFGESAAGPRLIFIAIILLGIVGLKVTSGH
ncbi:MAG: quaternary ammonium compound efflux SMR transporter SugE [Gemmataceae bacterium]